jgi:3-oxoadipate enol-lactonase
MTQPPILFLHSIGCDHRLWDAQVAALAEHAPVLRPDLRGHGAAPKPKGDYRLDDLIGDAVSVLDAAGVARAVVCGLSLGGLVAQGLALRAPERVSGLVLANTAPRIGAPEVWGQRAEVVRTQGLAAIAEMAMARFFSESFRREQPEVVAGFRERLIAASAAGYAGCCAVLRDTDISTEVARIRAPTLVLAGANDVSTPPDQLRALADTIPGARYRELDAAHLSNIEQPAAFTAEVRSFLEAL